MCWFDVDPLSTAAAACLIYGVIMAMGVWVNASEVQSIGPPIVHARLILDNSKNNDNTAAAECLIYGVIVTIDESKETLLSASHWCKWKKCYKARSSLYVCRTCTIGGPMLWSSHLHTVRHCILHRADCTCICIGKKMMFVQTQIWKEVFLRTKKARKLTDKPNIICMHGKWDVNKQTRQRTPANWFVQ